MNLVLIADESYFITEIEKTEALNFGDFSLLRYLNNNFSFRKIKRKLHTKCIYLTIFQEEG